MFCKCTLLSSFYAAYLLSCQHTFCTQKRLNSFSTCINKAQRNDTMSKVLHDDWARKELDRQKQEEYIMDSTNSRKEIFLLLCTRFLFKHTIIFYAKYIHVLCIKTGLHYAVYSQQNHQNYWPNIAVVRSCHIGSSLCYNKTYQGTSQNIDV